MTTYEVIDIAVSGIGAIFVGVSILLLVKQQKLFFLTREDNHNLNREILTNQTIDKNIITTESGKYEENYGISFTEYMILFHLYNVYSSLSCIDFARIENLSLTTSGAAKLLASLEKRGLIQKEENKRDSRASFFHIYSARFSCFQLSSAGESIVKTETELSGLFNKKVN